MADKQLYSHPFSFVPTDGPEKDIECTLPRKYIAFSSKGGLYVWDEIKESYVWHEGLTLKEWSEKQ